MRPCTVNSVFASKRRQDRDILGLTCNRAVTTTCRSKSAVARDHTIASRCRAVKPFISTSFEPKISIPTINNARPGSVKCLRNSLSTPFLVPPSEFEAKKPDTPWSCCTVPPEVRQSLCSQQRDRRLLQRVSKTSQCPRLLSAAKVSIAPRPRTASHVKRDRPQPELSNNLFAHLLKYGIYEHTTPTVRRKTVAYSRESNNNDIWDLSKPLVRTNRKPMVCFEPDTDTFLNQKLENILLSEQDYKFDVSNFVDDDAISCYLQSYKITNNKIKNTRLQFAKIQSRVRAALTIQVWFRYALKRKKAKISRKDTLELVAVNQRIAALRKFRRIMRVVSVFAPLLETEEKRKTLQYPDAHKWEKLANPLKRPNTLTNTHPSVPPSFTQVHEEIVEERADDSSASSSGHIDGSIIETALSSSPSLHPRLQRLSSSRNSIKSLSSLVSGSSMPSRSFDLDPNVCFSRKSCSEHSPSGWCQEEDESDAESYNSEFSDDYMHYEFETPEEL